MLTGPRSQAEEAHTTSNHARILIELDDMNFAHMTCKSSSSNTSRNIPQENGAIASGRCKLGIIVGPGKDKPMDCKRLCIVLTRIWKGFRSHEQ